MIVTPCAATVLIASARWHSSPSTVARAIFSRVIDRCVMPSSVPVAVGRLGVRSPSRYGTYTSPSAPGAADSASSDRLVWSTPSTRAVASRIRAAFSVTARCRCRPIASAKPATSPVWSFARVSETVPTTPDVPNDSIVSPGRSARASAAPALSPMPGPSTTCPAAPRPAPPSVPCPLPAPPPAPPTGVVILPARSCGARTLGSTMDSAAASEHRRARASRSRR